MQVGLAGLKQVILVVLLPLPRVGEGQGGGRQGRLERPPILHQTLTSVFSRKRERRDELRGKILS
jgi:hypothetical protein